MTTERIERLDIDRRELFTAIAGYTNDTFPGNDLKLYEFNQQLHFYLKKKKFDAIVFYDRGNNLFSYERESLSKILEVNASGTSSQGTSSQGTSSGANDGRPLGRFNPLKRAGNGERATGGNSDSRIATKETGASRSTLIYQIKSLKDEVLFAKFMEIITAKEYRTALIFNSPHIEIKGTDEFVAKLQAVYAASATDGNRNKVLINYNKPGCGHLTEYFQSSSDLFAHNFFKDLFLKPNVNNEPEYVFDRIFVLQFATTSEMGNLLNHLRLCEGLKLFGSVPFDRICSRLVRERKSNAEIKKMNLEKYIRDIDEKNAWDELKAMKGMDEAVKRMEGLVAALRRYKESIKEGKKPNKFRPHLVFKGPPGTGKTTVARLFARIMQEEGVLDTGHCVEAKVGDFIAEHIGGTRIKTAHKCDEAIGGALFIDEAYGFVAGNGNGNDGYGKEACEVLIQYMERDDFMLIVAGYEHDMNEFIKKGNDGLTRRLSNDHVLFGEYPLEILNEMLDLCFSRSSFGYTDEAKRKIREILKCKFENRTNVWGNAGEAENLIQQVETGCMKDTITLTDIPKALLDIANPPVVKYDWTALDNSLNEIYAQEDNVKALSSEIKRWLRRPRKDKPLVVLLAGTSGTGKSFTATQVGRALSACGYHYSSRCEFSMNSYGTPDRANTLFGSPTGYVGSTETPAIFDLRNKHEKLILVFNEIDKAHETIATSMMEWWETGMLSDGHGVKYDFRDTMIFLTSNLAMERLLQAKQGFNPVDSLDSGFIKVVKDILNGANMPTYITGRIECILVYNALSPKHVAAIVLRETRKLADGYGIRINRVHAAHLARIAGSEEIAKEGARPARTMTARIFEVPFQNYEGDKTGLLDIDENLNLAPSSDNELRDIKELAAATAIEERNSAPAPVAKPSEPPAVELPTARYFVGFSPDEYTKAAGLLKIDGGMSGEGTAFFVNPRGCVLTCAHCIVQGKRISFVDSEGVEREASILFKDDETDLAILKIALVERSPYLNVTASMIRLKTGANVGLFAYPKGSSLGVKVSYTAGIISKYERGMYYTTAIAAEGSSGGALVSIDDGLVYGVLKGGHRDSGVDVNVATDVLRLFLGAAVMH